MIGKFKEFFTGDLLKTRISIKLVLFVLVAGLIPLGIFAGSMYFTIYGEMKDRARNQLKNYLELSSGYLFRTLEIAEKQIQRRSVNSDTEITGVNPVFEKIYVLDKASDALDFSRMPWSSFPSRKLSALEKGETILSPPFKSQNAVGFAVMTPYKRESILVGELDPARVWEALRASYVGILDLYVVTGNNGTILYSSDHGYFEPLSRFEARDLFSSTGDEVKFTAGEVEIPGYKNAFWGRKTLYLESRFATRSWRIYLLRPTSEVYELPFYVLNSLAFYLGLSVLVLVWFALRGARRVTTPLEKIIDASRSISREEFVQLDSLDTGDELEDLMDAFNKMSVSLKEAREELYLKEKAIESASNGIIMIDDSGEVFYANDAFVRMFEFESETEVLGESPLDFFPETVHSEVEKGLKLEHIREEKSWAGELKARRSDGQLFDVKMMSNFVRSVEVDTTCVMAYFEDITTRKQREREL